MKVTKPTPGFQPFDIRIETEAEANLLASLLGAANSGVDRAVGGGVSSLSMYQALREYNKSSHKLEIIVKDRA